MSTDTPRPFSDDEQSKVLNMLNDLINAGNILCHVVEVERPKLTHSVELWRRSARTAQDHMFSMLGYKLIRDASGSAIGIEADVARSKA